MKNWIEKLLPLALSLSLTSCSLNAEQASASKFDMLPLPDKVSRFAFGSCAKETKPQPIWNTIASTKPELFLFIGDNVYADTWKADGVNLSMSPVTEATRIAQAYQTLDQIDDFARFKATVPMLGTWDDHDYGADDAGKHYALKAKSQQHFLDFFGFAHDAPIRHQEGIYHARLMGPQGQRVQFILLDTRYHRDDLIKGAVQRIPGKGPYVANPQTTASMLGEAQWQWLEKELEKEADIRFIISSIQLVAYQHRYESWGTLPLERQRFYDLIRKTGAEGVVVLSGDRHLTEVSVDKGQLGSNVPYPIWDLTASGMTDTQKPVVEENSFRRGAVYRGSHFASIDIDWQTPSQDTRIIFRALSAEGDLLNQQIIPLRDLQL